MLDVYVRETKKQEALDKERQRMFLMEKTFGYSYFDLFFPYHMYLGRLDPRSTSGEDIQLTTLRTFNRRRMYLIWLFYDKFDALLTDKEREIRDEAEHTVFKWNFLMKAGSVAMLALTLLRRRRNMSRVTNFFTDCVMLYSTTYCFLLSYVVGVHQAWPMYEKLAKKMVRSKKRVDIDKDVTLLDDFKIKYYKYDIAISKFF